jgi:hypothetical protein
VDAAAATLLSARHSSEVIPRRFIGDLEEADGEKGKPWQGSLLRDSVVSAAGVWGGDGGTWERSGSGVMLQAGKSRVRNFFLFFY